ncbi:replication initiator protein A [Caballeronia grimmiae]|uniref:RepA n=1 Tax=Caballeronia grimmiae TaxID=1071679 RepID=A0A069NA06_9BURK|nr:replication initiator protein A [Caballeronia grimmiae]KDR24912.1 RepA [Caballeronia grimmiae]GGD96379.1 plasmid replication initiator protein RepA [Caballeronia grimmiae]
MKAGPLVDANRVTADFFPAYLHDYAFKCDAASMELPIFSLSTKPDISISKWESQDGMRRITVKSSMLGRATLHDKDVLIFVASQLVAGVDRGLPETNTRTVRFRAYDYLIATGRGVSGAEYNALRSSLERLHGTILMTNVCTGGIRIDEGFNLIQRYTMVTNEEGPSRSGFVEVELSTWLYRALCAFEVFTLNDAYFRLRKPLERRLYELARKHCGHQALARIGLELLRQKAGSKATLKEFRRMVRAIASADNLPDYKILLGEKDIVTFYTRNTARLLQSLPGPNLSAGA